MNGNMNYGCSGIGNQPGQVPWARFPQPYTPQAARYLVWLNSELGRYGLIFRPDWRNPRWSMSWGG